MQMTFRDCFPAALPPSGLCSLALPQHYSHTLQVLQAALLPNTPLRSGKDWPQTSTETRDKLTSSKVYVRRVMSLVFTNSASLFLNSLSSLTLKDVGSMQNLEIWYVPPCRHASPSHWKDGNIRSAAAVTMTQA